MRLILIQGYFLLAIVTPGCGSSDRTRINSENVADIESTDHALQLPEASAAQSLAAVDVLAGDLLNGKTRTILMTDSVGTLLVGRSYRILHRVFNGVGYTYTAPENPAFGTGYWYKNNELRQSGDISVWGAMFRATRHTVFGVPCLQWNLRPNHCLALDQNWK